MTDWTDLLVLLIIWLIGWLTDWIYWLPDWQKMVLSYISDT